MTDLDPQPPRPHDGAPWWLRFALGAGILIFNVSPWNPAGFQWSVAIVALGLMGVLSFVKIDLAEMVRGMLPPAPQAPPLPPGPPAGPPVASPPTDGTTGP